MLQCIPFAPDRARSLCLLTACSSTGPHSLARPPTCPLVWSSGCLFARPPVYLLAPDCATLGELPIRVFTLPLTNSPTNKHICLPSSAGMPLDRLTDRPTAHSCPFKPSLNRSTAQPRTARLTTHSATANCPTAHSSTCLAAGHLLKHPFEHLLDRLPFRLHAWPLDHSTT
jgi:hypothetical protein